MAVTLPNAIRATVGANYRVKGSAGAGNQAEIPWVSVMPPGVMGASEGRYVVYLFTADGESVYLSLSQAVTGQPKGSLSGLAEKLRRDAGPQPDLLTEIELGGQGAWGAKYELATAYAIEYPADHLPPPDELEHDLARFVEMLDRVADAAGPGASAWIFQANPAYHEIDRALRELPEIEWTVRQYQQRVEVGDRVYIWRSGTGGGVVAVGTILSPVTEKEPASQDVPYLTNRELFGPKPRVSVRIDQVLGRPLLRTTLREDPVLGDLQILRFANATVFEVTPAQDARLQELLDNGEVVMRTSRPLLPETPSEPRPPLDFEALRIAVADRRLRIEIETLANLVAALRSGKHVIFTGPPGTAKTTLAEIVASVAADAGLCSGYMLTTATADWTTYETIGGLKPDTSGGLAFQEGHFLESIRRNEWLVIDELNRSNFDRAFGQLFTVLSGQAVELPYDRGGGAGRLVLVPEDAVGAQRADADLLIIPKTWRVIATMNVFDKSLLFEMSFALMRRFAFIEVPSPPESDFEALILEQTGGDEIAARIARRLLPLRRLKDLGPAVYMDLARFLYERRRIPNAGGDRQLAFEAFYSYLLPQFEGIDEVQGEKLYRQIRQLVGSENEERLRDTLRSVLGLELLLTRGVDDTDDGDAILEEEGLEIAEDAAGG